MSESPAENERAQTRGRVARANVGSTALGALVMLLVGFVFFKIAGEQPFYSADNAMVWTFRIGGVAMAVVALLCRLSWPHALLADALVCSITGTILTVVGMAWLANGRLLGALVILFGGMSMNTAWGSWRSYRSLSASAPQTAAAAPAAKVDSENDIGAAAPEEPRPQGYLSELGRQNEQKRTSA